MGATGGPKTKVRVAFSGEEYGFGYQALTKLLERADERPDGAPVHYHGLSDGGVSAISDKPPQELEKLQNQAMTRFDFTWETAQRQPLRTKEQSLIAVKQHTADYAMIPFYSPYSGYDFESLRAAASQLTLFGCEQVEATDSLCLAVYEPQVLEIVQAAHPGSALSSLLKHSRRSWNTGGESVRNGEPPIRGERNPKFYDSGEYYRAGLVIDQSQQMLLRDRIDAVFCSGEAARRCKSKLDGLRAAGVGVQETLNTVEPHREMARLARATLNTQRQTTSFFDPRTGQTSFASTMGAEAQQQKLYGVILPFQVAMMSPEYTIIDPYMEDSDQQKTRFMAVEYNPDLTLFEDAYRTTDAKTRYWMRRLRKVAKFSEHRWQMDRRGKGHDDHHDDHHDHGDGRTAKKFPGVRVMLVFQRAGAAASIGDVEAYLRNFGVRHMIVRLDEDSEMNMPANILLDVEFDARDFEHHPFSRRLRGSIVNGAMKLAFQRWKSRGVLVLAAMPFTEAQMPPHAPRHWLFNAVNEWIKDTAETWFVRSIRFPWVFVTIGLILWGSYALLKLLASMGFATPPMP